MKKLSSSIHISVLAMLLLSMALFVGVMPTRTVEAQTPTPTTIYVCVNPSNGDLLKLTTGTTCPRTHTRTAPIALAAKGVCKFRDSATGKWDAIEPRSVNGTYQLTADGKKCVLPPPVDPANYPAFVNFNSIPAYVPPSTTTNSNNPNTNTPNSNTNNGNTGGTTSPPLENCGDEPGFHKVGPLCVPDSPFDNKDALVNSGDASGLAARIIRILLYFAGIVAVIMAIIGGYQIMTAAGNETQVTNGRKTLVNALIGLAIVILSYIIVQAVMNFITK